MSNEIIKEKLQKAIDFLNENPSFEPFAANIFNSSLPTHIMGWRHENHGLIQVNPKVHDCASSIHYTTESDNIRLTICERK